QHRARRQVGGPTGGDTPEQPVGHGVLFRGVDIGGLAKREDRVGEHAHNGTALMAPWRNRGRGSTRSRLANGVPRSSAATASAAGAARVTGSRRSHSARVPARELRWTENAAALRPAE